MSHLFHYFKLGNKNIQAHVHVLVYNQYMYYFESHTERDREKDRRENEIFTWESFPSSVGSKMSLTDTNLKRTNSFH